MGWTRWGHSILTSTGGVDGGRVAGWAAADDADLGPQLLLGHRYSAQQTGEGLALQFENVV